MRPGLMGDGLMGRSVALMPGRIQGLMQTRKGVYPTTGATLASFMGFANAPTSYWHFTESSGDALDLAGSSDLTPADSPTQGVYVPALQSVTVQFTDNSAEGMDASGTGVLDVGDESVAVLWVGIVNSLPGTARQFLSKKASFAGAGYALWYNGGLTDYRFEAEATAQELAIVSATGTAGDVLGLLGVYDKTAGDTALHMWRNGSVTSSATGTAAAGSMTNATTFSIGQGQQVALGANAAAAAIWIGTNAEGLVSANLDNLMAKLGL